MSRCGATDSGNWTDADKLGTGREAVTLGIGLAVALRVKDGHHGVNATMFQQFPYTQIVSVDGLERKQLAGIPAITFQYSDRLFMQWDPDGFRLALLCLLRHILQKTGHLQSSVYSLIWICPMCVKVYLCVYG